jgi:hypothetical protein
VDLRLSYCLSQGILTEGGKNRTVDLQLLLILKLIFLQNMYLNEKVNHTGPYNALVKFPSAIVTMPEKEYTSNCPIAPILYTLFGMNYVNFGLNTGKGD